MAQLTKKAQLYLKISQNLIRDEVQDLRDLLVHDRILGRAQVDGATVLQLFKMLEDNKTISEGNLGFLEQVLRVLGQGTLADDVKQFEQEQKTKGATEQLAAAVQPSPDVQVEQVTSQMASLGTTGQPKKSQVRYQTKVERVKSAPGGLRSSAYNQDPKANLKVLLAKVKTPTAKKDKKQQFDLCCQIGDLYRTKLNDFQSALQHYQCMLECAQALSDNTKQAKAYSRQGLTYDMLVAKATRKKTEEMDIYCELGDLHRQQLNEPQVSYTYYTEMLALARDLGRKEEKQKAYKGLDRLAGT
ncbi:uncharacterized protein LOC118407178 [Branchiostoma floridae]|uniref:Uncharacterized protein LOC118407178 n=1 Tax=Branchiostoma floridae TaxID=7739 RepID=A0A9J7HS97_BRAFL|nr:uncharacterized protein LOC118407178 [Branchiostoma floridae]